MGDLEFSGGFLTTRRQFVHGRVVPFTKTRLVHRIDLSQALIETLRGLKLHRREQWSEKGQNEIPEWVFATVKATQRICTASRLDDRAEILYQ